LLLMCFYLTLCNSFVPLPTAWIILLAAAPQYAVVRDPLANVLLVSGLATLATIVANLTEYHLLANLLHFGLGARLRRTRVYGWAMRWFNRAPFQLLTLLAFVPIPVDAVRWLAILRGYSRWRFALAYLVGRGPRYLLFAGCSVLLDLGGREVLLIQVGLIVAALVGRGLWRLVRKSGAPGDEATLDAALTRGAGETAGG
jgi:membrane protein YqaA with SNARE-associated domain